MPAIPDSHPAESAQVPLPLKERIKRWVPKILLLVYRFFRTGDFLSVGSFLFRKIPSVTLVDRLMVIMRLYRVTYNVTCEHVESEVLPAMRAILSMPYETPGAVVEAGCFKGGGTTKLSIAAKLAQRELFVFDSFEGIPANSESHENNIWGGRVRFSKGDYCSPIDEVTENVRRFGELGVCRFIKGFFEDSMPGFREPVVVAYLDVDLASSTRTCLKYVWPLLVTGGILFSQDGHLPLVIEAFEDEDFWTQELNCAKPQIHGLGTSKLIWCRKDQRQALQGCEGS
jgi:O-methyltransferase